MREGGVAILGCPAALAYGDDGRPPNIPGGAATAYTVELLAVEEARPPAPQGRRPRP